MNIQIQKHQQSSYIATRKRALLSQINELKSKLHNYKMIQIQINLVSNLLKTKQNQFKLSQQSTPNGNKKKKCYFNQKIKIYQLKNKLKKKNKEKYQISHAYEKLLRKQQETLTSIYHIRQQFDNQHTLHQKLTTLTQSLLIDINRIQEYHKQNAELLANQKQILAISLAEKCNKIKQIKRLKLYLNQQQEPTSPSQSDIRQSLEENFIQHQKWNNKEDNQYSNWNFCYSSTSKNSFNKQKFRKFSQQIIKQERQNQVQSPQKQCLKKNDYKLNVENRTSIHKNLAKVQNQVNQTEQKIEKNKKLYNQLLQCLSFIRRGNKNLQASCKHSRVTSQLLQNRIQGAIIKNDQYSKQLFQNITKSDSLYKQLKYKQGKRGELRGHLGIKVENSRMLQIINEQLKYDLQRLKEKVTRLKDLQAECRTTIHKLMNACSTIQHNSTTTQNH